MLSLIVERIIHLVFTCYLSNGVMFTGFKLPLWLHPVSRLPLCSHCIRWSVQQVRSFQVQMDSIPFSIQFWLVDSSSDQRSEVTQCYANVIISYHAFVQIKAPPSCSLRHLQSL